MSLSSLYCIIFKKDDDFTDNFYNTIGIELKIKQINLDDKNYRIQIVNIIISGIQRDKKGFGQLHRAIISYQFNQGS